VVGARAGGPRLDGGLPCQLCIFQLIQNPNHECVLPVERIGASNCLHCS
jgi:hypothetical protein